MSVFFFLTWHILSLVYQSGEILPFSILKCHSWLVSLKACRMYFYFMISSPIMSSIRAFYITCFNNNDTMWSCTFSSLGFFNYSKACALLTVVMKDGSFPVCLHIQIYFFKCQYDCQKTFHGSHYLPPHPAPDGVLSFYLTQTCGLTWT